MLQAKLGENYIVALNLLSSSPQWLASIGALPMYLGLDLRGGVHFLLQVDMKAALDKKQDSYAADVRIAPAQGKDPVLGHLARRRQRRDALPRRRRAHQGARRDREELSRSRVPRERRRRRRAAPRREPQARGAHEGPGKRRRAEHPDPAQSRQRARRRRAHHPAAGRGARGRAASRRAGHRAREGHPRPHRVARDPHGQRRPGRARRRARRQRPARQRPLHRAQRHQARWCGGRSC